MHAIRVGAKGVQAAMSPSRASLARWTRLALRLAVCAVGFWTTARVFAVFNERFLHNGAGYDEEFFAWGGWCITKGLAPYKEFIEFKPPFVFITHALAQKLFGFEHFGYRRFFALFPLASILALQGSLMLRKVDAVLASALAVSMVALWVHPAFHDTALSDSESIGLSYFLLGLAFLLAETKYRNGTDAVGAAFMTCAALSKEPYMPVVVMTWASVFCLRDRVGSLPSRAIRYFKFTGLGVAAVVLGLCVYMVPTGSMRAYLTMVSNYHRMYQDPKLSYCALLGVYHPSTPMNELKVQWEDIRTRFVNLALLGYMAPFFAAAFVCIPRRSLLLMATVCLGLVAALWAPTATRCGWPHYYTMCDSGLIAFLAIGLDAMKGSFWTSDRSMRMFVRVAVVGVAVNALYPRYESESRVVQAIPTPHEPLPGLFAFIAKNTAPTDRILTTGPPLLYAYTNRIGAIRESTIIDEVLGGYEGATDEDKLRPIRDELVRNMPKVVILDPEHADRKRRHMNALINPFLTEFHYRKENDNIYVRP
jgi:hypothetical protein